MTIDTNRLTGFFGTKWDAPILDGKTEVPIPIGEHCHYCTEEVLEGDRGIFMPVHRAEWNTTRVEPVHRECNLRAVMGPLAHLRQECACYGGDKHDDDYGMTTRESALAVWREITGSDR